jgi:hypothetical protein
MTGRPDQFGPWADGIDSAERLARFRSLRALVQVFAGPRHPLVVALAQAEADPTDDAAALLAWECLTAMPTIRRRRILASLATLIRTSNSTRERKTNHG